MRPALPVLAAALVLIAACQKPADTPAASATATASSSSEGGVREIRSTSTAAGVGLGGGSTSVVGRTATVSLPFRTSEGKAWVSATRVAEAQPFVFKGLEVKPGAGPDGSDLAVFTYEASGPGSATLKFGLVPGGSMLIGPEAMVYKGPVDRRYETTVSAK